MTEDNVKNINDYRKNNDAVDANNSSAVSSKSAPAKLSEKLRNAIPSGLRAQMRQQMRNKHGI
ncbi:hypothetical protein [Enterobacter hormaechei]|uniref:hypothetical protein n=1 Tax=Enterobacter hormaechei TaxID=158836 RepID=UPI001DCFB38B|nr:hypothetical protein [Enterobacter hormaechei]CAE7357848.1 hypothetical protein AI2656V1_4994 [Enterobacter cloacae]MCW9750151.1 hypothetical protein [Enterobacter hormaechei]CAE7406172.1 hypothetical protein AI2658V1_4994 [Enterobacter cloacae]CAF2872525.1 hypothetical protein AI2939V1_4994 [Enterobacter cloacae]CAH3946902.1 hypothetical protein AI2656V1_4994 [Enterobacter cloacae]